MKRETIPPELPPIPDIQTSKGHHSGRVAGVAAACLLVGILLVLFFMAFLTIPAEDYVVIFVIGIIAPLMFSFPFLFK